MRWIFLNIFILVSSFSFYAQNTAKDLEDEIILNTPLLFNNADSGLAVAKKWLSQATKEKNVMAQIRSQVAISNLYTFKSDNETGQKKMDEVISIARNQKDPLAIQFVLMAKANHYFSIQKYRESIEDHDEILNLHNKNKSKNLLIDYYQYMANYHYKQKDSLLFYLGKGLLESKFQKNNEKVATMYTNIGSVLNKKTAEYEKAKTYLDSSIIVCKKYNYLKTLGLSLQLYASSFHKQNNYEAALIELQKCQVIQAKIGDQAIISTKNIQANIFASLGRINDAIQYYIEAINLGIKFNASRRMPGLYQNIGSTYMDLKQIDSAKHYLQKAIKLAQNLGDNHIYAYAIYNYASILKEEGNYIEAKKGMIASLNKFEEIQETANVAWVLPRIVEIEIEQYEKDKNDKTLSSFIELKKMLDRAVSLNANGNNYETLENIYDCYTRLGRLTNNSDMTFEYQNKLLILKDTVFNQQKLKTEMEMAAKLKDAEQQAMIAQLEIKNNKAAYQKNLAFFLLVFSILGGIGLYYNYRHRMRRKNELNLMKQKEEFRNQVSSDLHDDVGTLLTGVALQSELASMSADENQKNSLLEISSMSRAAMEQMRDIVWALDSRKDKYENLIDRMRAFAEQQLHLKNINHKFIFELPNGGQAIAPHVRQNVYLIFKEAITNIVKHSNADFVNISFVQKENQNELSIVDNGNSLNEKNTDGLGLTNMKQRAKNINGTLDIKLDDGYTINLIF